MSDESDIERSSIVEFGNNDQMVYCFAEIFRHDEHTKVRPWGNRWLSIPNEAARDRSIMSIIDHYQLAAVPYIGRRSSRQGNVPVDLEFLVERSRRRLDKIKPSP